MRASCLGKSLVLLVGLAGAVSPTSAQIERPHPQYAITGDIGFRDASGKVWTPDNVGQPDSKPVPLEDRAFDPRQQVVQTPTVSIQAPGFRVLGTVPVTSGPGSAVPLVTLEAPALHLSNRGRWIAPLVVANNSERLIDAEITCRFNNDGQLVEQAKVQLRGIEPGQRVAAVAYGPQPHLFINNTVCAVDSPLQ